MKRKYVIGVGDVVTLMSTYYKHYPSYKDRVGTVTAINTWDGEYIATVSFWDDPSERHNYVFTCDLKRLAKAKHDPDQTSLPEG